ncbi:MAG: hypothetical protein QNJ58_16920 [Desulfobacterales bacterium]|nr:hypothetical protein [Desulfobacterales bacterium]
MGISIDSIRILDPSDSKSEPLVARFGDWPVYAVRARQSGDRYALGVIRKATMELLTVAEQNGHSRILAQLLAAGGRLADQNVRPHLRRSYPAHFSLIQMVWAYAGWHDSANKQNPPQLSIYIVDPSVYMEVSSGRLDILELLNAPTNLRFWAEINWPSGRVEHYLVDASYNETVRLIAEQVDIPRQNWVIEVIPPMREDQKVFELSDPYVWDDSILWLGITPGGTVRFRQACS